MSAPRHVLLVEDNPGDADLMKDTLESGATAPRVSLAIDGVDALDRLRRDGGLSGMLG